jgi:hypothetical protein
MDALGVLRSSVVRNALSALRGEPAFEFWGNEYTVGDCEWHNDKPVWVKVRRSLPSFIHSFLP